MMLRDVIESDLPILFEHQREPEGNRLAAFPARDRDAFMAHWKTKVLGNPTGLKKAIVVEDEVVGNILSWDSDGHREVGYWLGRAFWGRGLATAAIRAFLAEHEKTRPLDAFVANHNHGSIRALEKNGFERKETIVEDDGVEMVHLQLAPPTP